MKTLISGLFRRGRRIVEREDEMNREVLEVLEKDAKATQKQISAMTGLPVSQVRATIEEAERTRVILKYKTVVNWD